MTEVFSVKKEYILKQAQISTEHKHILPKHTVQFSMLHTKNPIIIWSRPSGESVREQQKNQMSRKHDLQRKAE